MNLISLDHKAVLTKIVQREIETAVGLRNRAQRRSSNTFDHLKALNSKINQMPPEHLDFKFNRNQLRLLEELMTRISNTLTQSVIPTYFNRIEELGKNAENNAENMKQIASYEKYINENKKRIDILNQLLDNVKQEL